MRVLLVEDDPRLSSDLSRTLQAAGYLVETSDNGEQAWFLGDTEDYGAVVLDLGLPGMDGLSVLKRWRTAGRHMPVLILTARASWAERVDGIDAGADDREEDRLGIRGAEARRIQRIGNHRLHLAAQPVPAADKAIVHEQPPATGWQFCRVTAVPVAARTCAKKRCECRCRHR